MKELFLKYKEVIAYLFFGGLTTVVNIVAYFVCTSIFALNYLVANAIAWVASVAFAYVTNRTWVFESKVKGFSAIHGYGYYVCQCGFNRHTRRYC